MNGSSPASTTPPVRARRWRVPPPLTRAGELLEGTEVLTEVTGETAVLLWKSLRTVTLWASASPQDQVMELFAPGARQRRLSELLAADLDPALGGPLEALTVLLDQPMRARREVVALSCRQVAQWAAAKRCPHTEVAFTQAAALACPADAELALQVARLTRALGEMARAESWCRRAIMLGRQAGNWNAYSRAFLTLGIMARNRGNYPVARRFNLKALRASTRHGATEVRAMSLHELFMVSGECDDASVAQRYAEQAFQAYGSQHPQARFLAHDLCLLWMREGQFRRALRVLKSLAPLFPEEEKLTITTNLARAAGGVPDRESFDDAWRRAMPLLERVQTRGSVGGSLLALARGATGVGEWELARTMAERALAVATETRNGTLIFSAESVLAFAQSRRAVESAAHRSANEPVEQEADRLASEMVTSFHALAAV
jgi:tetratricopeptide (TPR) repeat protein